LAALLAAARLPDVGPVAAARRQRGAQVLKADWVLLTNEKVDDGCLREACLKR